MQVKGFQHTPMCCLLWSPCVTFPSLVTQTKQIVIHALKVDPKTMSGSSHSDACKEKQGRRTVLCKAVLRKSQ